MTDTAPLPAVEVVWRSYRIERQRSISVARGFLIGAAFSIPIWAALGVTAALILS